MVPDGYFKVWVNNEEELRAVCEELEGTGIRWTSGHTATRFKPDAVPTGLEIGYAASHGMGSDRRISYESKFDEWKSSKHFDADIYTVDDIVSTPLFGGCDSVFSAISF